MKKITTLVLAVILGFSLLGCADILGAQETTTTVPITVDYENIIDVSTPQELQDMEFDRSYKLVNDIDLTGFDFQPLGDFSQPFLGNFDGNGYTISNLTIDDDNTIYAGLFGKSAGDVSNLTLDNVFINYETDFLTYAGALAGYTEGSVDNVTVTNVSIDITNTESNTYSGLLLGYTQPKLADYPTAELFVANEIKNSSAQGSISIDSEDIPFIGGFIGKVFNSHIKNNVSVVDLDVTLNNQMAYVGGLIGHNYGGILVGYEEEVDDPFIYIEENVAISDITVTTNSNNITLGGLTGYDHYSFTRNNYADSDITLSGSANIELELNIGTFLGENWYSNVKDNFSIYSLQNNLTGEHELSTETIFVGLELSDEIFLNNYICSKSDTVDVSEFDELDSITFQQSQAPSFYSAVLGWSQEFIDKFLD